MTKETFIKELDKILNRETVIEKLEALKAEFEEDKYILLNQTVAIQIIEKHIAELKEQKGE